MLAKGLSLNGGQLEPPRFHLVDWKVGDKFSASDDPDRTRDAWTPPDFVREDPKARHSCLSVEELELQVKPSAQSFARIVRNVLSEKQCAALVSAVNAKGFTPALLNIGGGYQELAPDCRDGFRVIVDSDPLTSWLLEVLRPFLPKDMDDGRTRRLHSLNGRCRFLCYTPGQEFGAHYDGCFVHPRTGAVSHVTVQLYLHDVPRENGGATTFLEQGTSGITACDGLLCQPEAGSVLVFSQDLLHEGSRLKRGLKYTFRTEAMYID